MLNWHKERQAYKYLPITPFVLLFSLPNKNASDFLWLPWDISFFLSKNIHIKFQGKSLKPEYEHHQIKPRHGSEFMGHWLPTNSIHHPGQTPLLSKFATSQEWWQRLLFRKNPPSKHRRFRDLDKSSNYIWNVNFVCFPLLLVVKTVLCPCRTTSTD